MKLNNKGWGTTQMILLSGGILLALLIVVYFISMLYGSMDASVRNRHYVELETTIESATKEYIYRNNIQIDSEKRVSLETLINEGLIKEFNDGNGNKCDGYVMITRIDVANSYKGYIKCQNYQSNNY